MASISFHPDGVALLSGGGDGTARIWPIPALLASTGEQISILLEARTGTAISENSALVVLDRDTWQVQQKKMIDAGFLHEDMTLIE